MHDSLSWLNIFIDESGKSADDRLFSCAAVLVEAAQLQSARNAVEIIACQLSSGGEIKSTSIGDNHARRIKFLEAIQQIDFQYVCLVVDKHYIRDNSGLRFDKSFNKFFKRLLHKPLNTYACGGIKAVFDNYGWPQTMQEFERYMANRIQQNLFFEYQVSHVDSRSERLVQLADLIAGSINWCFDPWRKCDESWQFRELLRNKELSIIAWPPRTRSEIGGEAIDDTNIAQQALLRVQGLINRYEDSLIQDKRAMAIVLEELLFARIFEEGHRQSIYADSLPGVLDQHGIVMNIRQVRSLVGNIRDAGIVVAGSPNGYKLALTPPDITEYLTHTESIVGPMLARVRLAREAVKLDTSGRYDILHASTSLRHMVEAIGDAPLHMLTESESYEEGDTVFELGEI
jgi:hypothetical protein